MTIKYFEFDRASLSLYILNQIMIKITNTPGESFNRYFNKEPHERI